MHNIRFGGGQAQSVHDLISGVATKTSYVLVIYLPCCANQKSEGTFLPLRASWSIEAANIRVISRLDVTNEPRLD